MLDSDLKTYHSVEVSRLVTNGGRMSANEVISGVVNNVWPQVPKSRRLAGDVLHRKLHLKAADDNDGTLIAAQEYIDRPTEADDFIVAFFGTHTDEESSLTGNEQKYGAAYITSDITGNPSVFTVTVEDSSLATGTDAIFADGDKIRLTNKVTPDATPGTEEELTISGAPSVSGSDVTITVTETIANDYLVSEESRASSIMVKGDIGCSTENFAVTTAGDGDYDDGNHPIITDNIGTVEDSVTVSFNDATHFTVTGSSDLSDIAYGTGDTGTNFSPTNSDFSKPYFTLESVGFSGTYAGGDTITFDTHPASFSYWLRRTVPIDCNSLANNKSTTVTAGESDS